MKSHNRTPTQDLFCAVKQYDIVKIEELIEGKVDLHQEDPINKGMTPLHYSSERGATDVAELLLNSGINVKLIESINPQKTPLHLATKGGHVEIVGLLIDYKFDINATDHLGMTPLHLAVQEGCCSIAKMLINAGAFIDKKNAEELTSFDLAMKANDTSIISLFHRKKVNIRRISHLYEREEPISTINNISNDVYSERNFDFFFQSESYTSILETSAIPDYSKSYTSILEENSIPDYHSMIKSNDTKILNSFIYKEKNNINRRDAKGWTLLHYAAIYGTLSIVNYLLHENADADIGDSERKTPIHHIAEAEKQKYDVLHILIESAKNINVKDNEGRTVFHLVMQRRFLKFSSKEDSGICEAILKALIAKGADVREIDIKGNTALHYFINSSAVEALSFILDETNANINAKNNDGQTLLHLLLKQETRYCHALVTYIIQHKDLDINAQDNQGSTALHYFARRQRFKYPATERPEGINSFLKNGADVSIKDSEEKTPYDYIKNLRKFKKIDEIKELLHPEKREANDTEYTSISSNKRKHNEIESPKKKDAYSHTNKVLKARRNNSHSSRSP